MATKTRYRMSTLEKRTLLLTGIAMGLVFGTGVVLATSSLFTVAPLWIAIIPAALSGPVFGLGMSWMIARTWRRAGGLSSAKAMRVALRDRRLPADADPTLWNDLLTRQEKNLGRTTATMLLLAALAIGYLVLALTDALPDLGPFVWIGVFLFAAVAVYTPIEARNRRARIRLLREQLPVVSARP